jgi:hypothetical protein
MKSQLLAAAAASVASLTIGLAGSASGAGAQPGAAPPPAPDKTFHMVRSATALAAHCLGRADAIVKITKLANAERMVIQASGLPHNTDFDVFINQVPNAPFGMSWYQGDLNTDATGSGTVTFIGRFSIETFSVAPGVAPAPVVHPADAASNPATPPVHQYHVGMWFNSPTDAAAAGCPNNVTPFNGDHTAGVQAMSTRNFPDGAGPLRSVS